MRPRALVYQVFSLGNRPWAILLLTVSEAGHPVHRSVLVTFVERASDLEWYCLVQESALSSEGAAFVEYWYQIQALHGLT